MYKIVIILACCVIYIQCQSGCGDNINCVENELVRYIDKIEEKPEVSILGDYLVLSKATTSGRFAAPRSGEGLIERCVRYLADHEIKFRIPAANSRSFLEEGRTSKIKKILLPLLILLKLKAAVVIPAVLSLIALVAFKGLGASLIALAISGATGLKSLLEHHSSNKFTYEVVPQLSSPHWSRVGGVDSMGSMGSPIPSLPSGYHTIP